MHRRDGAPRLPAHQHGGATIGSRDTTGRGAAVVQIRMAAGSRNGWGMRIPARIRDVPWPPRSGPKTDGGEARA
jgi:hypothetical protein